MSISKLSADRRAPRSSAIRTASSRRRRLRIAGKLKQKVLERHVEFATERTDKKGDCRMLGYRTLAALVLLLTAENALAQDARAQRGRTFAQTNCASCHAIGRLGESPLRIAPPFRTLHTRYPVENLAEAFAEGIVTGHPTMPQFRLDAAQVGDLLAYLRTLEH
jgi:cytochrome c553